MKDEQGASLLIKVTVATGGLRAVLTDQDGRILLERIVPLDEGLVPAVRTVVLLARRAIQILEEEPPIPEVDYFAREAARISETEREEEASPDAVAVAHAELAETDEPLVTGEPEPRWLGLEASVLAAGWRRPRSLLLGPALRMETSLPFWTELRLGGRVALPGVFCCGLSTSAMEADSKETMLLGQASLRLLSSPRTSLDVLAGGGIGWMFLDASPSVFEGEVATERFSFGGALGIVGATMQFEIHGGSFLRIESGALLRAGTHRLRLPPAWKDRDDPLESGWITPWAGVGVGRLVY